MYFSRADPDLTPHRGSSTQVKGMAHISVLGTGVDLKKKEKEPEAHREKVGKG